MKRREFITLIGTASRGLALAARPYRISCSILRDGRRRHEGARTSEHTEL